MRRSSQGTWPALGTPAVVGAMAFSLVALVLVSGQRYHWLTIGAENDQGYGYGYEPAAIDLAAQLNIDGPTVSRAGVKVITVEVTNSSVDAVVVDPSQHIDVTVTRNGTEIGEVVTLSDAATISSGETETFRFQWLYRDLVSRSDPLLYSACVDVPGDVDDSDDCSQEAVIAR
jgi:hypothetical protein